MLERAWKAGVKAAWVTGDAAHGGDVHFRRALESHGQPYVLAVRSDQRLHDGRWRDRVGAIAERLPARAWRKVSAGSVSKGPRWYDWAAEPFGEADDRGWRLWLLVRRHRGRHDERAKRNCGLAGYEVRSWVGWYRHVTLLMFALALLAVIRSRVASGPSPREKGGLG